MKWSFCHLSKKGQGFSEIEAEISSRGIKINREDNLYFDSRDCQGPPGHCCTVAPRGYADFDELMEVSLPSDNEAPLFLLLDGVEDRRIRSCLRVADAGGVHGVVIQAYPGCIPQPRSWSRPQQAPRNTFLYQWCRILKTLSGT